MSESERFLTRWSRRKLDPAAGEALREGNVAPKNEGPAPVPSGDAAVEFDISKLPPLESLNATSDIRPFLQAGVPLTLQREALRRAWSADPAIRDFIGLNENFWDIAGIGAAPGFGPLDPNLDIKSLVANLFGEGKTNVESATADSIPEQSAAGSPEAEPAAGAMHERNVATANAPVSALQFGADEPSHRDKTAGRNMQVARRRHGGAIPQ